MNEISGRSKKQQTTLKAILTIRDTSLALSLRQRPNATLERNEKEKKGDLSPKRRVGSLLVESAFTSAAATAERPAVCHLHWMHSRASQFLARAGASSLATRLRTLAKCATGRGVLSENSLVAARNERSSRSGPSGSHRDDKAQTRRESGTSARKDTAKYLRSA